MPLTSLTKKERQQLMDLGEQILKRVGQGVGDFWFEAITFQARRPCTDDEISLSAWEPRVVAE